MRPWRRSWFAWVRAAVASFAILNPEARPGATVMSDRPPALSPPVEPLLDIPDVARRLGVASKTVRRLIDRGELAVHRIGRLLRVSEADLHSYVVSRRQIQSNGLV